MYYIKRKFDAIDKYNDKISDKLKTDKESQSGYMENLKEIGLSDKEIEVFDTIFKSLNSRNKE